MFLSLAHAQDGELNSSVPVVLDTTVEHGSNFPPFDSSFFGSHLFWLAISFAIFYFLMARLIIPRLGSIIETRRDRITSDLELAGLLKQEADAAIELYEQQLHQARINAHNIAREAMDEAKASTDRERAEIESALSLRLEQSTSQINLLQSRAMEHVDKIAAEVTEAILSNLIYKKPDAATLNRAVKLAAQN